MEAICLLGASNTKLATDIEFLGQRKSFLEDKLAGDIESSGFFNYLVEYSCVCLELVLKERERQENKHLMSSILSAAVNQQ